MAPSSDDICSHRSNGSPCRRPAITTVDGKHLCKAHAALTGAVATSPSSSPWRLRRADATRLTELSTDPELVDPRQLIAVQRVFLEKVISPPDDVIERKAMEVLRARWTGEREATADDLDEADIQEVMDRITRDSLYYLDKHTKHAIDAYKVLKVEEALMNRVQPILARLGQAVSRVLEEEVKDAALLERIRQRLDTESSIIATEMRAAADEVKR